MLEAQKLVSQLPGVNPISEQRICAGYNSRVYRVDCEDGKVFAVKFYLHTTADGCSRLEQEWTALSFMKRAGITCVPQPILQRQDVQAAVYTYLQGQRIEERDGSEINALLHFLGALKDCSQQDGASSLKNAAEACFSPKEIVDNLQVRITRLKQLPYSDDLFKAMHSFLDRDFAVELEKSIEAAGIVFPKDEWSHKLPQIKKMLSPSDFGFHNALRGPGGKLFFLDFEYFGWDDPVKATADFLLHPAMILTEYEMKEFYLGMKELFADDVSFEARFKVLLPLYRLKWCLIILNEFFKEALKRRRFASGSVEADEDLRERQLSKAQLFLGRDKEILGVLF